MSATNAREEGKKSNNNATSSSSSRRHFSTELRQHACKKLVVVSDGGSGGDDDGSLLGVSIGGWDIGTSQGQRGDRAWFRMAMEKYEPLSQCQKKSDDNDADRRKRSINLPRLVFPSAYVALENRTKNLWISWDIIDALDSWAIAHRFIPVDTDIYKDGVSVFQENDHRDNDAPWKKPVAAQHNADDSGGGGSSNNNNNIESSSFHYDWTFSSPFAVAVDGGKWEPIPKSGIPVESLKDKSQPILFFDEIVLYEDDLHGKGHVQFSVKIRVMPSSAFVLSRMCLRMDNVVVRIRETRLLVSFATGEIHRDVTWRECPWEKLGHHRLPTDPRVWRSREGLGLLSKLPQVQPPKGIHRYAVLKY